MKITELVRFAALLIRRGRVRKKVYDFSGERDHILRDFRGIVAPRVEHAPLKSALMKIPFVSTLVSEAAFVKRSLRSRGGHLTSADGKLVYVRIPKAASTAVCKAILQNRFPSLKTDTMSPEQINAVADHCLETAMEQAEDPAVFTIVRNPFSRIVSVYREFFEEARGHLLYEDYLMGIFRRDISFRQFVDITRAIPDKLKDQHLMPQACLLRYYDERDIAVRIFKMEQAESASRYLAAQGLRLDVVHKNPEAYDYRTYYDRETLERVNEIYERDISRFGYAAVYGEIKSTIEQRDVQI